MTPRVLVEHGELAPGQVLPLADDATHHLLRVLRLGDGAEVALFDGRGAAALARLTSSRPPTVTVTHRLADEPEPLPITLVQGISAGDKMDWTIEKAVELGVTRILPVQASRSIVRLDARRIASREAHWHRLVVAACAQCGRNRLPELAPVVSLAQWLANDGGPPQARRWLLDPTAPRSLASAVAQIGGDARADDHWLLCGPESGLAADEAAAARSQGWLPVSLGPRVLRTETAGLAAIVTIQSLAGDHR